MPARRWKPTWLVIGLGAATAVAAAVVVIVLSGNGEAGVVAKQTAGNSPSDGLPEPDPGAAERTLSYLAGEGAPALVMHRAARDLPARPTAEQCRQVADALDRDAPPDQLVLVIEGVADEVLRTALSDERASIGATLTAGVRGREPPADDRITPLPEISRLVQERLDALEAAR